MHSCIISIYCLSLLFHLQRKCLVCYFVNVVLDKYLADSYAEALKKAEAAELTSDLSASETCDRRTRHDRCKVLETDQDHEQVSVANTATNKRPPPSVLPFDSIDASGLCAKHLQYRQDSI